MAKSFVERPGLNLSQDQLINVIEEADKIWNLEEGTTYFDNFCKKLNELSAEKKINSIVCCGIGALSGNRSPNQDDAAKSAPFLQLTLLIRLQRKLELEPNKVILLEPQFLDADLDVLSSNKKGYGYLCSKSKAEIRKQKPDQLCFFYLPRLTLFELNGLLELNRGNYHNIIFYGHNLHSFALDKCEDTPALKKMSSDNITEHKVAVAGDTTNSAFGDSVFNTILN